MDLQWNDDGAAIQRHRFAYRPSSDQQAPMPVRHPVVIVGAGPVGLSLAIDLAQRGQQVLVLDNDDRLSNGSRAICFAKRTLEIWDRLGVGDAICGKGVDWRVGRVFFGDGEVYRFDLQPQDGHERPAFVNLQQYYAEAYLTLRAEALGSIDIRWRNAVVAVDPQPDGVRLTIDTPAGAYHLLADHLVACDGSRSTVRGLMGLESRGRTFRDRFLIADVRMQAEFPAERWFWFDPPFHRGQSVLLHRQPDGVWRIDFQLGWDADPEREKEPARIATRIDAMMQTALGRSVPWSLEWASVYTFACLRMDRFVHDRVIFAGDSAHGVSPFGARGANSGVQDADNLGWKLDLVLRGIAPRALLESYQLERTAAADENLSNSTRATDFITPKTSVSRLFRDATLSLARHFGFARALVNSGRLSVPATLAASPLNTADADRFAGGPPPGAPAIDAPLVPEGWLLRRLAGHGFTALLFGDDGRAGAQLRAARIPGLDLDLVELPADGIAAQRYDARPGTTYLLRPDQHVCARWRNPRADDVADALRRALALDRKAAGESR